MENRDIREPLITLAGQTIGRMMGIMLRDFVTTISQRVLTPDEISEAAQGLLDASVPDAAKIDFLRAWAKRGETAEELAACAETFLPQARDPGLRGSWRGKPLLDCCGTGGGGLHLLNISTGLMFILSAMNIPVVKHGNRGITKSSGSADVLEAMGININLTPKDVPRCLEEVGCAFLFAPAYHTTFATVAPARRALASEGQRTIFNLIGPLLNPARPDARLVGVFQPEHVALYEHALELMGCPKFTVACGQDEESGRMIGEVSAWGESLIASTLIGHDGQAFAQLSRKPDPLPRETLDSLLVRNADESAARLEAIFSGEDQGLNRDTLLVNAAVASWTHGTSQSLETGLAHATEILDAGKALAQLRKWQRYSES